MTWTYHTAERMGWSNWTRKRRRKFKKRYLKQHGVRFRWFVVTYRYAHKSFQIPPEFIIYQRGREVGLGATVK